MEEYNLSNDDVPFFLLWYDDANDAVDAVVDVAEGVAEDEEEDADLRDGSVRTIPNAYITYHITTLD